ncbi:MAG TPA: hypothetical protein VGR98_02560, partial [Streptosporangiaceae bacterium]|nr:hypothetical protein [Streptosporangiaceae bacterium]
MSAGPGWPCAGSATAGQATFEPDEDEELLDEESDDADPDDPPLTVVVFLSPPLSPLPSEDDPESEPELDAPSLAFP